MGESASAVHWLTSSVKNAVPLGLKAPPLAGWHLATAREHRVGQLHEGKSAIDQDRLTAGCQVLSRHRMKLVISDDDAGLKAALTQCDSLAR